jgi:NADH-quinone oxidoreductase subunit L
MENLLHIFILLPLAGFVISLFLPVKKETLISWTAFCIIGAHFLCFLFFFFYWLLQGHQTFQIRSLVLFRSNGYEFFIAFCFDKISAIFLFVGALLTFLVTIYSRYYLHRETGYKRFFNTILFFYLGYNIAILSGNLETLFIGWEVLGICSFLLIAFYRDRYLPVKNALKVFSVYRIGDVGLILAIWMNHHLWSANITFLQLHNAELVSEHLQNHSGTGIFISLMLLITAAAKSAQLPFSSWLPRAMEGPTPSSAIFYGSLSVHLGVFILLRTYPFWEHQFSVRVLIAAVGAATGVVASLVARVQSSVKTQIAYASAAQIGLIFIEVACGFENMALLHFAGNAFLRTYQLLVSPSVVSYLIREQFYNFKPRALTVEDSFPKKLEHSLYLLSLKEWSLDSFMYRFLWKPLKVLGKQLRFFSSRALLLIFIPLFAAGLFCLYAERAVPAQLHVLLPSAFSLLGLVLVLKSFSERKNPLMSWELVMMNHFCIALAISFNEHFKYNQILLYLSGVLVSGVTGYLFLRRLRYFESGFDLNRFHGHIYEHPKIALAFLLSCLGMAGFPITPTFLGEDLIFSHIHENQPALAFFVSFSFIISGLSLVRMYARLFLGPHEKTYHETPYRSS